MGGEQLKLWAAAIWALALGPGPVAFGIQPPCPGGMVGAMARAAEPGGPSRTPRGACPGGPGSGRTGGRRPPSRQPLARTPGCLRLGLAPAEGTRGPPAPPPAPAGGGVVNAQAFDGNSVHSHEAALGDAPAEVGEVRLLQKKAAVPPPTAGGGASSPTPAGASVRPTGRPGHPPRAGWPGGSRPPVGALACHPPGWLSCKGRVSPSGAPALNCLASQALVRGPRSGGPQPRAAGRDPGRR